MKVESNHSLSHQKQTKKKNDPEKKQKKRKKEKPVSSIEKLLVDCSHAPSPLFLCFFETIRTSLKYNQTNEDCLPFHAPREKPQSGELILSPPPPPLSLISCKSFFSHPIVLSTSPFSFFAAVLKISFPLGSSEKKKKNKKKQKKKNNKTPKKK